MLHLDFRMHPIHYQTMLPTLVILILYYWEGDFKPYKSYYLKKIYIYTVLMFSLPNVYRDSHFNFQHQLDLNYPLIYELPSSSAVTIEAFLLSLIKYGSCPERTETVSHHTSEWNLFNVPVRFRSPDLSQMFCGNCLLSCRLLWRSSLSFKARSSVACKHSTDTEICI